MYKLKQFKRNHLLLNILQNVICMSVIKKSFKPNVHKAPRAREASPSQPQHHECPTSRLRCKSLNVSHVIT